MLVLGKVTRDDTDVCYVFFFSSRRRHTRCSRDWSSDVCSSDLPGDQGKTLSLNVPRITVGHVLHSELQQIRSSRLERLEAKENTRDPADSLIEIGRASCRERV